MWETTLAREGPKEGSIDEKNPKDLKSCDTVHLNFVKSLS
jgi:hypothetical protein